MITITKKMIRKESFLITVLLFVLFSLVGVGQAANNHGEHHHQPRSASRALESAVDASSCVDGMAEIYPCSNINLLTHLPFGDMSGGSTEGTGVWGWTDEASKREFALVGGENGLEFVEVTNPGTPVVLGHLPSPRSSFWRDVKTHDNYALVVSEQGEHGLQLFDLTQLLAITETTVFTVSAQLGDFGAHTVISDEESDFVYAARVQNCNRGLLMIDLSDPLNPVDAGCVDSVGSTNDAHCVIYNGRDSDYIGKEICLVLSHSRESMIIVDVTDKAQPIEIAVGTYDGAFYPHQGWLTEDMSYFLMGDEGDERDDVNTTTLIWDVSDLDNPVLVDRYIATTSAIDHNLHIKGDYVYQANYQAGVRILDASDVENGNLTEVGYFDLYPDGDAAEFDGAWSTYPFFESGTLLATDMLNGLFVLQPELEPTSVPLSLDVLELDQVLSGVAKYILVMVLVFTAVTLASTLLILGKQRLRA